MNWWQGFGATRDMSPVESYRAHFDAIRSGLPASIVAFDAEHTLHDSKLLRFATDVMNKSAHLVLRGWDMELEHERDYQLTYSGVTHIGLQPNDPEDAWPSDGLGDIGYDEFDVIGMEFQHSLLFSSGAEFMIRFVGLEFDVRNVAEEEPAFSSI
jgi:hypothetical protein